MARPTRSVCLIGGGTDSLCLGYYLQKNTCSNVTLLSLKRRCPFVNTHYYDSQVLETGWYYSFVQGSESSLLSSLIRDLRAEGDVVESNRYSSSISFMDEHGKIYKYERFNSFISKHIDDKICNNLIFPYCYHYFGFSPRHVLMGSYFHSFVERTKEENKSLVHCLISRHNTDEKKSSFFIKKKKNVKFRGGNIILAKKIKDHLQLCSNTQWVGNVQNLQVRCKRGSIQVRIGREVLKCEEVILCLNPQELKTILKRKHFHLKNKHILTKFLSKFCANKIKITNVCYRKNILPLSHSLESLLLVKQNKMNSIISMLYDSHIFPQVEESSSVESPFETSLRFMSFECDEKKCKEEIKTFLRDILKVKEHPDLVVSNNFSVFPFDERLDRMFKQLLKKRCKKLKIFWTFSFFKNMEFCLSEAHKLSRDYA
ncbi:conserved Plasmodium protein, unknown function [Plasmodium ovale curtisi]|uniref:Amine oxidase domain-containing protein n=1 Tax=Plasmodium ovale curtisi TaxID=864141 RepID=A0A1A8VLY7_PLAOA|nr:conserved Plasmodium protein, unknown function [Plasmodium ovale curtisi]